MFVMGDKMTSLNTNNLAQTTHNTGCVIAYTTSVLKTIIVGVWHFSLLHSNYKLNWKTLSSPKKVTSCYWPLVDIQFYVFPPKE